MQSLTHELGYSRLFATAETPMPMNRDPDYPPDFDDDDSLDESLDILAHRPRTVPGRAPAHPIARPFTNTFLSEAADEVPAAFERSRSYHAPPRHLLPGQDTLPDDPRRVVLDIPTDLPPSPPGVALIRGLSSNRPRARVLAMAIGIAFALPLLAIGRWTVFSHDASASTSIEAAPAPAEGMLAQVAAPPAAPTSTPAPSPVEAHAPAEAIAIASPPAPSDQPGDPSGAEERHAEPRSSRSGRRAHASDRSAPSPSPTVSDSSGFVPPNAAQFREDFTR